MTDGAGDRHRESRLLAAHRAAEAAEAAAAAAERAARDAEEGATRAPLRRRLALSFRTRLMFGVLSAAVLPVTVVGIVVLLFQAPSTGDQTLARLLLFGVALTVVFGVLFAYLLAGDLTEPLRRIAAAVGRAAAGEATATIEVPGDDEVARLAESHNRLVRDTSRRNRELGRILVAIEDASPRDGIEWLVRRAARDARLAFDMIDAEILLVDPVEVPVEEPVPGDPLPVRAELRTGGETLGVLVGHLPATRSWERADQDLLELFALEIAVAIRNAELFAHVEEQNQRLVLLDRAKDDFLRGVSHNLQTPLASIRAYAGQLDGEQPDRRLGIIGEQADRLSRMVRQLLTVSRLESGALRPKADVLALGQRVRRTWEALAVPEVPFELRDGSAGWLAVADPDQLDQVLWALLDNALKYGRGSAVDVTIEPEAVSSRLRLTVTDHGPGVAESDRARMFGRFQRGAEGASSEGSGLGLYVSRELCRAMGGDLVLEPAAPGQGAAFSVWLPAESAEES